MPAPTETQLRVDTWSKCTLLGATLLFVYSLLVLVVSIHADHDFHRMHPELDHHRHGGKHHGGFFSRSHPHNNEEQEGSSRHHHFRGQEEDGPCRLHHFAILGLITSVTGMISGFKNKRGWALSFLILVLVTEISALGYIGYKNSQAVKMCTVAATHETLVIEASPIKLPNGNIREHVSVLGAAIEVSKSQLEHCTSGVRHAAVIASLLIGVIACSLAVCGSRFSNSLSEREEEEVQEQQQQGRIVTVSTTTSCGDDEDKNVVMMKPVVAVLVPSHESSMTKEQPVLI